MTRIGTGERTQGSRCHPCHRSACAPPFANDSGESTARVAGARATNGGVSGAVVSPREGAGAPLAENRGSTGCATCAHLCTRFLRVCDDAWGLTWQVGLTGRRRRLPCAACITTCRFGLSLRKPVARPVVSRAWAGQLLKPQSSVGRSLRVCRGGNRRGRSSRSGARHGVLRKA